MARMSKETRNFISNQISSDYCREQISLGVEIVSIERFRRVIERTPRIVSKLFSSEEIKKSLKTSDQTRYYAGIIAAKEALMKALGVGFFDCNVSQDIEVLNRDGKWIAQLSGVPDEIASSRGIIEIPVSITYTTDEATSCVAAITQSSVDDIKMKNSSIDELTRKFKETRFLLDDI